MHIDAYCHTSGAVTADRGECRTCHFVTQHSNSDSASAFLQGTANLALQEAKVATV